MTTEQTERMLTSLDRIETSLMVLKCLVAFAILVLVGILIQLHI